MLLLHQYLNGDGHSCWWGIASSKRRIVSPMKIKCMGRTIINSEEMKIVSEERLIEAVCERKG